LLIAIPGAIVAWRSYQAFKRRQRDSNPQPDIATDRWWRIAGYAAAVLFGDLGLIVAASAAGAPKWISTGLFIILAAAVAVVFIAAFMLGWRSTVG
jgi:hypothetical protein